MALARTYPHILRRHQELNFASGRYRAYLENEFYLFERLRDQDSFDKQGSVLGDLLVFLYVLLTHISHA